MIPPFYRLRRLPVTESTNADMKLAAEQGEPAGLVIQAAVQTVGRGRQGRQWDSPEGNIYTSILLRPNCSLQDGACYSFVTALAIYDTVEAYLPNAPLQLKWPNDVLVADKKVSGILLESAATNDNRVDWLVVGIGLNVRYHPDNAAYPTTSLAAADPLASPPAVDAVLETLLEKFEARRLQFVNNGFEPIRQEWVKRAKTGQITARLPNETVEGAFIGLNPQGSLILRLADGRERAIAAGDIFFPVKDDGNAIGDRRREHQHGLRPL